MSLRFSKRGECTEEERAAVTDYYAEATYFHACAQGWSGPLGDSPKLSAFMARAAGLAGRIDAAIEKFEVAEPGEVYFGSGSGYSCIGSLGGPPERFVGLTYQYLGYTSTSIHRSVAEDFVRARASGSLSPVLLQIILVPGMRALPVDQVTGQCGEGEVLLPRKSRLVIKAASSVRIDDVEPDVLLLELA